VVFPFDNAWSQDSDETTWGAGAGLRVQPWSRIWLELDYIFHHSRGRFLSDIAGSGALAPGLSVARDLPHLLTIDHQLEQAIRLKIGEHTSIRFAYRLDDSTIEDFSQRALVPETVLADSGAIFLGHVDRDFTAHVFTLTFQIRL
jgi:hypothetical protein